jgi:hypothetical protein
MASSDRERQVKTMRKRYGEDAYKKIGAMRKVDPYLQKYASWKRWHPEKFDEYKRLLPEYVKEFYGENYPSDPRQGGKS